MLRACACVVLVALAVGSAGCYVPEAASHEVDFDGTVERTDGTFRMTGHVEIDSGTAPTRNFTAVSIVLYESPDTVDERIRLGDMSTDSSVAPSRRPVNVTRTSTPAYVLIESPDFWAGDELTDDLNGMIAFRWTGEEYEWYFVESKDERFEQ